MNPLKTASVLLLCAALAALAAKIIHAGWLYSYSNPFILVACTASAVILLTAKGRKRKTFRVAGVALVSLIIIITSAMATDNPILWLITDPAIIITCTAAGLVAWREE